MQAADMEDGAIAVLSALSIMVLLLMLSLALYIAHFVLTQSEAQSALDAAVLTATGALPHAVQSGNTTRVKKLLESFNGPADPMNKVLGASPEIFFTWGAAQTTQNKVEFVNFTGAVPAPTVTSLSLANGISATKTYSSYLGGVMRSTLADISVTSTAVLGGTKCEVPRLPVTLLDCRLAGIQDHCELPCDTGPGDEREIVFAGSRAPKNTGAYFGYSVPTWGIDPVNPNADYCRDTVNQTDKDHIIPELCAGTIVRLNNGQIQSCFDAIAAKFNTEKAGGVWNVYVPVVACSDLKVHENGDYQPVQDVPIAGFANIGITGVMESGGDKYITYRLNCITSEGKSGGAYSCGITSGIPTIVQ